MSASNAYKASGVDIDAGDDFSAYCAKICRASYGNSPFVVVNDFSSGNFRGPRGYQFQYLPAGYEMTLAPDGIGTKVILISASSCYRGAARNLLAMTADDISCWGGMPLVFSNILDAKRIGKPGTPRFRRFQQMMTGLGEEAHEQGIVLLNGETAELRDCVTSEHPRSLVQFNWPGVMHGVYHKDKLILGETLRTGQTVMALQDGFRSNGISLTRAALRKKFGKRWSTNPKARTAIQYASLPSIVYSRFLVGLNGWNDRSFHNEAAMPIHFIAHLSGGSIKGKFAGMLKRHELSADLDDLHEPPQIMRDCASWARVSDEDCYSVWNGGQGALVVIDTQNVNLFTRYAEPFGIKVKPVGRIRKLKHPRVRLKSKFTGKWITF